VETGPELLLLGAAPHGEEAAAGPPESLPIAQEAEAGDLADGVYTEGQAVKLDRAGCSQRDSQIARDLMSHLNELLKPRQGAKAKLAKVAKKWARS
jgi:hypothetical protein